VSAGLDITLCPSPMDPDTLEHLIIPQLSLAFISSNYYSSYDGKRYRHIRLDAIVENDRMKSHKARIRFSKKIFSLLMREAVATLADAKKLHDELEVIYNPYVDFKGVYKLAAEHSDALARLL